MAGNPLQEAQLRLFELPEPEEPADTGAAHGLRGCLAALVESGLSVETALALHRAYAGLAVHVPLRIPAGAAGDAHPLVEALGREGAEALCRLTGGHKLTVPKQPYEPRRLARLVRRDLDRGEHRHTIARRYGIHERTVWEIAGKG